jgi:hypothetical protein
MAPRIRRPDNAGEEGNLPAQEIHFRRLCMSTVLVEDGSLAVDLSSRATLPPHVVYRVFVKETVVLNLKTGKYHGLNPTAGRMLDVIRRSESIQSAIEKLAQEYETEIDVVARDVRNLCQHLLERDLIEISAG